MRLQRAMGYALLSVKYNCLCETVVKESCNFELSCQKKKKTFWPFVTYWLSTFVMLFHTTVTLGDHKKQWYIAIKAYKGIIFERFSALLPKRAVTISICSSIAI